MSLSLSSLNSFHLKNEQSPSLALVVFMLHILLDFELTVDDWFVNPTTSLEVKKSKKLNLPNSDIRGEIQGPMIYVSITFSIYVMFSPHLFNKF